MNQSDCYLCRAINKTRTKENSLELDKEYDNIFWNETESRLYDIYDSANGQQVHRDCLPHFRYLEKRFHQCDCKCPNQEEVMVILDKRYDSTEINWGQFEEKKPWTFNQTNKEKANDRVKDQNDYEMEDLTNMFKGLTLNYK